MTLGRVYGAPRLIVNANRTAERFQRRAVAADAILLQATCHKDVGQREERSMRAATTRSFILILGLLLLVGGLPGLARAQEATPNGQSGTLCDDPTPDKANLSDVPAEGVFVSPLSRP